jgi:hypothetical protein
MVAAPQNLVRGACAVLCARTDCCHIVLCDAGMCVGWGRLQRLLALRQRVWDHMVVLLRWLCGRHCSSSCQQQGSMCWCVEHNMWSDGALQWGSSCCILLCGAWVLRLSLNAVAVISVAAADM